MWTKTSDLESGVPGATKALNVNVLVVPLVIFQVVVPEGAAVIVIVA